MRIPDSELSPGPERWERYKQRQEHRRQYGKEFRDYFRKIRAITDPDLREAAIAEIRSRAVQLGMQPILIDMLEEAGRDYSNSLTTIRRVFYSELQELSEGLRIHPAVRESRARQIRMGRMMMFIAINNAEPAGRVNYLRDGAREEAVKAEIGRTAWVDDLFVTEYHRFKGIGTMLMAQCERAAKASARRPLKIGLGVEPDNNEAIKIYENLGYSPRKIRGEETYCPEGEYEGDIRPPLVLMVKHLN